MKVYSTRLPQDPHQNLPQNLPQNPQDPHQNGLIRKIEFAAKILLESFYETFGEPPRLPGCALDMAVQVYIVKFGVEQRLDERLPCSFQSWIR